MNNEKPQHSENKKRSRMIRIFLVIDVCAIIAIGICVGLLVKKSLSQQEVVPQNEMTQGDFQQKYTDKILQAIESKTIVMVESVTQSDDGAQAQVSVETPDLMQLYQDYLSKKQESGADTVDRMFEYILAYVSNPSQMTTVTVTVPATFQDGSWIVDEESVRKNVVNEQFNQVLIEHISQMEPFEIEMEAKPEFTIERGTGL